MASELITSVHGSEVSRGERFEFGKNWSRFLSTLDDAKIVETRLPALSKSAEDTGLLTVKLDA